ncbi:MAG: thermonuclease family protein [Thermodesulfovibrionales bacterium]
MDRSTAVFWGLIIILLSASAFFGVNVMQQRRSIHKAAGSLENGDLVQLLSVVDGDTVVVGKEGADNVTVRILGIKAFESKLEHDIVAPYGRASEDAIRRTASGKYFRIMLNVPPKDDRGRTLATLFSGDQDLGLWLVQQGLVLVYTVYPFPAMPVYLQEQEKARSASRGFWENSEVTARANALMQEWQRQAK